MYNVFHSIINFKLLFHLCVLLTLMVYLFCLVYMCLLSLSSLFNVFLTQNYELQFSFSVIITCNNIQYIVNSFCSLFFFFIKYVVSCYYDQYLFHLVLLLDIITDI